MQVSPNLSVFRRANQVHSLARVLFQIVKLTRIMGTPVILISPVVNSPDLELPALIGVIAVEGMLVLGRPEGARIFVFGENMVNSSQ